MKAKIFWLSFLAGTILAAAWLYLRQPKVTVIGPPDGCLFGSRWYETYGGMHTGG